ncbi:MAG: hypothetical protein K1X31_03700 [Gemmatimonadaceae bacterium]|nr:hypothetical protein [Gemmatimonadaceae bacterium]
MLSVYDNANGVGTGQVHSSYSVYLYGGQNNALSGAITYTVTSSDPAIATVLTPTVTTPSYGYLYAPRILGRAPGTVTLTWAGADFDTITTNFTVRTPELLLQNFTFASTFEADSAQYNVFANAVHSGGYAGPVDDTVFAVVRSTDPAVVQVTDSVLRFNPGTYFSNGGRVRMIGPGTARLIVSAPGYTPDTTAVITLRPYRLDVSAGIVAFGRGLEMTLPVVRRAWTGAALPFTASISGPAGMTVVETSPSFAAGANLAQLTLRSGTATGSDFLIVAAAGLAPDTVRFDVGPSAILTLTNGFLYVGEDAEVGARLRPAGTFAYYPPSDSVRLLLQVRDSTLLSAVADTVVFVRGSVAPTLTATVRGLRPGAGWVILSDPSGRFAADSAFVTVGRQELQLGRSSVEIGMQQETYAGELYFYRPSGTTDSLWVRLGSSAPGVVQPVQDSVLIAPGAYYGYFEIAAGDSVGGAVITGSAPGYLDFALPVRVSQTKLELILDYDVVPGQGTGASLYLNNASSYEARATRVAVPVRLDVEDTTVVRLGADSLVAIAAGASSAFPGEAFIGVATGRTRVFASDPRTGVFQQALNAWTTTDVHQPRLTASGGGVLILTPGATTFNYYVVRDYGIRSAIWVQARSVGGRFRVDGDSVFLGQNSTSEYFSLTGLSAGTDTLVLSAPGYAPDTVVVRLEPGILEASSLPSSLAAGDSVRVTVYLRNANGAGTAVGDTPLTVTFGATGAIVPRDDQGGTLTEGVLPPGEMQFLMWVVATGTGGGEIVISAPGFQPLRFRINTRGTTQ